METLWLMPSYFETFVCKADKCRNSCCRGWRIPVSRSEYYRLMALDCSPELRQRLENAFALPDVSTEERFRLLSFNWLGDCHLPGICALYPRSYKRFNGTNIACASASCEKVTEMILETEDLMLVERKRDELPRICIDTDDITRKEVKHFQDLLLDRSTTLEHSLREICLLINAESFEADYQTEINPVREALYLLQALCQKNSRLSFWKDRILERYQNSYLQYEKDREEFEAKHEDWMLFMERLLNNSMLYNSFPASDSRLSKTQAYKGLCAAYGLLRLVCVYGGRSGKEEDLADAISALFHLIDHTPFFYNAAMISRAAALLLKI